MATKLFLYLNIISSSLLAQKIIFDAKPMSFNEQDIRKELNIYPSSIISQCVEQVLVKELDDNTLGMSHCLFKSVDLNNKATKQQLPEIIHHELSSMFLLNIDSGYSNKAFKYYQRKFYDLNPSDFNYDLNIGISIPIRVLTDEEKKYFVCNTYGMTHFENDWNQICEALFTNPAFLQKIKTNMPVYKKALLAIEFYHDRIDSKFTLEYFKDRLSN